MLRDKHILVGVTGSIAAYKAAMLVRALVKGGAEVKIVMTPLAKEFITPLTLATLAKNPILVDFFNPENGEWNSHVSLGEWADAYVIAPATANTLAKMAHGIADNLLLTTYLSARCPVFVAPAMDLDMYAHVTTCQNIAMLRSHGVHIIEPGEGELASGLSGKGRMAEADEIAACLSSFFEKEMTLQGKRFLVTAGPTVEAIDPVRYISNHSTGKMGYAIATELASRGAEVILVSGPVSLPVPTGVRRVDVVSAKEMFEASMAAFADVDGAVMCAAVADYTPANPENSKIKRKDDIVLQLKPTKDIAAELGRVKGEKLLIGFALETDNEETNAKGKLERKNLDYVVLNSLRDEGAGFGVDTNKITVIGRDGTAIAYPLESKAQAASHIVSLVENFFKK